MKILIVRFSSIGDIVLTTPVIRCLKKQLEGVELHFLTKSNYKTLLDNNPHLSKIHTIDKSIDEVLPQLESEKFDVLIDLHHNIRTASLKRKLKVKSYSFNKENINKWFLVKFKVDKMPDVHIVDRYMDTVEPLGVKNDMQGIDYFIPKSAAFELQEYGLSKDDYYVYAIGGQFATKKMPEEKIVSLCNKVNAKLVLIGGKEDADAASFIMNNSESDSLINLVGKLSLNESAWLTKNCKALITHDTGMMHIASAFNKKIVSIWGNTVPKLGMYAYEPQTPENVVLIENNVSCRPCSKIGYQSCPKKHFECMNHDVDVILKSLNP